MVPKHVLRAVRGGPELRSCRPAPAHGRQRYVDPADAVVLLAAADGNREAPPDEPVGIAADRSWILGEEPGIRFSRRRVGNAVVKQTSPRRAFSPLS